MNPKHLRVRMDRTDGKIWITEERRHAPVRRLKEITSDVLLALCADLIAEDNSEAVEREVWFAEQDGQRWGAKIRVEAIKK